MKFHARILPALGLGLACLATPASAEILNWVTYKPQGSGDPQALTMQWFADELDRRTNGEYTIRIHWGGSIANMSEVPTALESGLGDIGDVVTPIFPDQLLVNNAISYFYPQPNPSVQLGMLMEYWHQTYPQFGEELAQYNLKKVGLRPLEPYGMICTQPVRTVEDLEGLRIRTYGFAMPAVVEAVGGVAVSMTTAESYEALERGVIDCAPVGPTLAAGWRFDEVAKYYVDVPFGASWGHIIAMNIDSYNALPEEIQTEIESIGREYLLRYTVEMERQEREIRRRWTESGDVEIISFPAEEFLDAISGHPSIENVRKEWMERAAQTGLEVDEIVPVLQY